MSSKGFLVIILSLDTLSVLLTNLFSHLIQAIGGWSLGNPAVTGLY